MKLDIDLTTLILSAVYVAEADGRPMSACDIAFMLEMPQAEVDKSLSQLVTNGSISQDGALYRCDLNRSFTASESAKMDELHDQFEQLRAVLAWIRVRSTADDSQRQRGHQNAMPASASKKPPLG